MILKHRYNLSDKEVVAGVHENVAWMTFSVVPPEEAHFVKSSTLYKFQKRLGIVGTETVETLVREQVWKGKRISSFMRVDITTMGKRFAYPTDSGLLQRGLVRQFRLIKGIEMEGVAVPKGLPSFVRVSRTTILSMAKFDRYKKKRISRGVNTLLSFA